jgi:hypothetical protein
MIKLVDLVKEVISASEAYNDLDAVQTIVDGKRGVAFIAWKTMPDRYVEPVQKLIRDNNLKSMYVKGNKYDAYVVYAPGFEKNATELKDIAEKYGGYLHHDASEEDSRRIGQLLNYKESDIEDYITRNRESKK